MLALWSLLLSSSLALGTGSTGAAELAPDGRFAVYSEWTSPGRNELFRVPTDGSALPVRLNADLVVNGSVIHFALSPDGTRVVYSADQEVDDVVELYGVSSQGGSAPVKLSLPLVANRSVGNFVLTPDGSRVVFLVGLNSIATRFELFSAPLDGSAAAVKLSGTLVAGGSVERYEPSPDGSRVVYVADALVNGDFEALSVPADGSAPAVVLSTLGASVVHAVISPDSSRVVFTGTGSVFSAPIDGSTAPLQIGDQNGVYELCFTPDSSRVVYRNLDELFSAQLDASQPALRLAGNLIGNFELAPDGSRVAFVTEPFFPEGQFLVSVRPDGTLPRILAEPFEFARLAITPGSHRVVFLDGDLAPRLFSANLTRRTPTVPLSADPVTDFRFVPGREELVFQTGSTLIPIVPELFHGPASGARPSESLGLGEILELGGDRGKRTLLSATGSPSDRSGLLLFRVAVTADDSGLFVQPWDGSQPARRLDL